MENIDDLLCKHCEGCGFVLSPEWEDWGRNHNEMPPPGHPLYEVRQERTCPECDGEGLAPPRDKDFWLRTDSSQEAVSTLEMFAEAMERVRDDLYRWKWAILFLHSAVQGFMAHTLSGRGQGLIQDDLAGEWLNAQRQCGNSTEERLDSFLGMYKKIKRDWMLSHSEKAELNGHQDSSMKRLQSFRNKLTQFNPVGWAMDVRGLPGICLDCMEMINYLLESAGNTFKESLRGRAFKALGNARQSLEELQDHYEKSS